MVYLWLYALLQELLHFFRPNYGLSKFKSIAITFLYRCYNKYLDFQRSSVKTNDYQRIKLQELDTIDDDVARIPRTFEVEVRGSLVNTTIPGDLLCVTGIVKTMQVFLYYRSA